MRAPTISGGVHHLPGKQGCPGWQVLKAFTKPAEVSWPWRGFSGFLKSGAGLVFPRCGRKEGGPRHFLTRANAAQLLTAAGLTVEGAGAEGIFLWSRLPPHVDAERLSLDAQAQGILLAKGALFSPTGQCADCLRFNVAYAADPVLIQFLSSRTGTSPAHRL